MLPVEIPTTYNTNREDLYRAVEALIEAFIASEDYEVGRAYRSALETLTGEVPVVVLGDVSETIVHDAQTRRTVFGCTMWYIDWMTSREEYIARVNRWADRIRDLFTYNARILRDETDGELVQTSFTPGELTQGKVTLGAPSITFELRVQGGYR